jgi:TrmH family RNA methyltransferase
LLGIVFDRPTSPGNVGTLIRSIDAFSADGLVVTGHAADVYDPKAVRASTGSLFAVPVVRSDSSADVLSWARTREARSSAPTRPAVSISTGATSPCLHWSSSATRRRA